MVRPDRRSVQRTPLRPTDYRFVRELVHKLQTELAGSGDHDGGSRDLGDPYNDPAVGSALPSRVRKALAALRSARRRLVEDGRDLYKGSRTMGVPVPRCRQSGSDGGLLGRVKVRSSQYLNNLVEQDHRRVKQRIRPMLGFKRFDHAVVTISGIELAEKIKKGQFKTGKLGGCDATMTGLWNAALAA